MKEDEKKALARGNMQMTNFFQTKRGKVERLEDMEWEESVFFPPPSFKDWRI